MIKQLFLKACNILKLLLPAFLNPLLESWRSWTFHIVIRSIWHPLHSAKFLEKSQQTLLKIKWGFFSTFFFSETSLGIKHFSYYNQDHLTLSALCQSSEKKSLVSRHISRHRSLVGIEIRFLLNPLQKNL
jgi:hypothetical protein